MTLCWGPSTEAALPRAAHLQSSPHPSRCWVPALTSSSPCCRCITYRSEHPLFSLLHHQRTSCKWPVFFLIPLLWDVAHVSWKLVKTVDCFFCAHEDIFPPSAGVPAAVVVNTQSQHNVWQQWRERLRHIFVQRQQSTYHSSQPRSEVLSKICCWTCRGLAFFFF